MKRRILITDGEQRASLAVVRSLGHAGHEVHVCSSRMRTISSSSRYSAASHIVADPLSEPERFLSDLVGIAIRMRADVLLPITEAALLAVLPSRNQFECSIPFAEAAAFERICDKRQVLAAAHSHGIAVPDQKEVETPEDIVGLNGEVLFPLVLKPSRSVSGTEVARIRAGVRYAASQSALSEGLKRIPAAAYPVLLQQHVSGPGFGICVLVWDGKLLGAFAHRRIREKPPSGGVSVLRESIPLDQDLLLRSLALLQDFNWRGVAMVEYKLDSGRGVPYLMEVNGRLWGSLQLAIDAGVNFPDLLVRAALGENPSPVTSYKSGVRLRWEWGDVDHLLASLIHDQPAVATSQSGVPIRRLAVLKEFLRGFGRANRSEVFRTDDPGPFLRETLDWLQRR